MTITTDRIDNLEVKFNKSTDLTEDYELSEYILNLLREVEVEGGYESVHSRDYDSEIERLRAENEILKKELKVQRALSTSYYLQEVERLMND